MPTPPPVKHRMITTTRTWSVKGEKSITVLEKNAKMSENGQGLPTSNHVNKGNNKQQPPLVANHVLQQRSSYLSPSLGGEINLANKKAVINKVTDDEYGSMATPTDTPTRSCRHSTAQTQSYKDRKRKSSHSRY